LPDQPEPGVIRLAIGGDSRDDRSHVVPWAFQEATKRGAMAFVFLGDLEITSFADRLFMPLLRDLAGIPFYPVIGNHEVELFGTVRLSSDRRAIEKFKEDFLRKPGIRPAPLQQVVYSAEIGKVIHFIALDNVSRRGEGFGDEQLSWLARDLQAASAAKSIILVGMHKALAKNPITTHAMDEDGPSAVRESDAALALFKQYGVAMLFVSHSHMYAAYNQDGIETRLTGGLGAPLVKGLADADGGFHHFLLLDVPPDGNKALLRVEVVRFAGPPTRDQQDESAEVED
jgi:3',5'-cyclic AMP phosphodiesterase CpdA